MNASANDDDASDKARPAVARLVKQFLVGRVDDLDAQGVAAFVSGWTSALELMKRTDLILPDADEAVTDAVVRLVSLIESVQREVLTDEEE